jgi:glycosyltransferase involved in cell wall biosynthesis
MTGAKRTSNSSVNHPRGTHGTGLAESDAGGGVATDEAVSLCVIIATSLYGPDPFQRERVVRLINVDAPKVSVIMLTFNRPQFISRAIESVQAQTLQNWELLVVQDGDNQDLRQTLGQWREREKRLRWFHRDKPGNIADATNYALQRAQAAYVAVLDDDDAWADPDKLLRQVEFLDQHPDYAACGGGVIVVDTEDREQLRYRKPQDDNEIRRVALVANPMVHSAGMFRRDALAQLGNYDVSLKGFQDWDVWLKLGMSGKLYNFPDYWLRYRIWPGGGSFQAQRGNTESAVRIVWRYRRYYRRFPLAMLLALAYFVYSWLPLPIRRATFKFLSMRKKAVFGS